MNRLQTTNSLYYPQPIYEKVINRTKCPIDKIVTIHITILMGHTELVSCENLQQQLRSQREIASVLVELSSPSLFHCFPLIKPQKKKKITVSNNHKTINKKYENPKPEIFLSPKTPNPKFLKTLTQKSTHELNDLPEKFDAFNDLLRHCRSPTSNRNSGTFHLSLEFPYFCLVTEKI